MPGGLDGLVRRGDAVARIATGFSFTEGPVWDHDGSYLLFSDMPADVRRRWSENDGVQEIVRPSNRCNGMVYDATGALLVCEHSTSRVMRERAGAGRETLASHYRGRELNSPNDIVTRSDGTIYFTDPAYGRTQEFGVARDQELSFQGVYRLAPDASEVTLVVDEYEFEAPNGLCFSPDESRLYVNDTVRALIRVYDVRSDGALTDGRLFFENIAGGAPGAPDGMKCDERGNVWVTAPGGIWVISPAAQLLGTIDVPEVVGNLAWGGPGWRTLYITASSSVYRLPTRVASARLPYH
jgi:gluconolactonase